MRNLIIAGLLVATAAGHTHSHTCIHDTPEMRRALHSLPLTGPQDEAADFKVVELTRRTPFKAQGDRTDMVVNGPEELLTTAVVRQDYGGEAGQGRRSVGSRRDGDLPIRIVFRTPDLDDSNKYCTAAGQTRSTLLSDTQTVTCTQDDVLTLAKKRRLIDEILPKAAQALSSILRVARVSGNLKPGSTSVCTSRFTIPQSDVDTGVPNSDFVVYVAAAPTPGSTVAWAGYCALDQNGRPVIARTNFSPKYLAPSNPTEYNSLVRTGVHELLHALGFSSDYIQSTYSKFAVKDAIVKGETRRGGQPVTLYTGPSAVDGLKKTFACWDATGVELEDEGGDGTAGSHWDRRFHKEDVMAGIVGDVMTYSEMTFGVLEDSGHYTIDRTAVEEERYMRGAGCDVFSNKCNTVAGGKDKYFCFDTSTTRHCTLDYTGYGTCRIATYDADLPAWGQYFSSPDVGGSADLMNYCPIVEAFSDRQCNQYDSGPNNTNVGLYFGSDGRCFRTTPTLYYNSVGPSNGDARCFQSRCPDGNRVEFKIGNSAWTQCPTDGSSATINAPSPYTGQVVCPTASDFCTADLFFGVQTTPTTTPTISSTSTTKATTQASTDNTPSDSQSSAVTVTDSDSEVTSTVTSTDFTVTSTGGSTDSTMAADDDVDSTTTSPNETAPDFFDNGAQSGLRSFFATTAVMVLLVAFSLPFPQ